MSDCFVLYLLLTCMKKKTSGADKFTNNNKSRFDDVVKALVENKRGGNDYKSVLEILNIYQAVGDMHFIGERDYFNKIAEKLKKELGTDQ